MGTGKKRWSMLAALSLALGVGAGVHRGLRRPRADTPTGAERVGAR